MSTVERQYLFINILEEQKKSGVTYKKYDVTGDAYIYYLYSTSSANGWISTLNMRGYCYYGDYGLIEKNCHKVTITLNVKKMHGSGKLYVYLLEQELGTDAKIAFSQLVQGTKITSLRVTETETEYKIELTNKTQIENFIRYGMSFDAVQDSGSTEYEVYIEKANAVFDYVEQEKAPEINIRKDLMTNGGFYPEDRAMDYYQYVDKPFVLAWEYFQEASVPVGETTIKIHTYATNDGIPAQDWDVTGFTYTGNVGTCTIPEYIWKRLPCGGRIEITVTSNNNKSNFEILAFDVPFHKVVITKPEKDSTIKYEVDNLIQWEKQDISGFIAFPAVSGYRILISTNNGATYEPIVEIEGDIQEYLFREKTLPVGVVSVRVVALYDNNTVAQNLEFGESRYIVGADAETSTVTCDGKPIPTVAWESVAQTAYQVKFGDYDSGAVYSADKYHKIPYIFSDGVYDVTVRTQNSTGEWSKWTGPIYVQITNAPPGLGITATAEPAGHRVKVVWTKNSGYVDYIVYRNGVPIHITDGGISTDGGYMDSMANGVSVYMVRGITADGYYDQSAEITVNAAVQTDILFVLGSDEILPLKYTPVFSRTYNYAAEMAVTYRYFAGRSKPVAITSGQISRTLPLSYIDKGRTLARKLLSYVGKTVVFKDSGGDMIVGVLNMANAGMGHVSTTSFQITEVDYNERVAYLPGE